MNTHLPKNQESAKPLLGTRPLRSLGLVVWGLVVLLVWISQALAENPDDPATGPETSESGKPPPAGMIAITLDDLPAVSVYDKAERVHITERLLGSLAEHKVSATGFVIGGNIDSDWDLLASWLDNGHTLGSHTFSHYDLHIVQVEMFIEDMIKGASVIESFLDGFEQKRRYFRHPYLHYGENPKVRKRVEAILAGNKHVISHVSVDTDDYLYNLRMDGMKRSSDSSRFALLRAEYIDHILESLSRSERLADIILKRPVKHILLLHANRLNALFLGDLLTALEEFGYRFITLRNALKDPVYRMKDKYYGPNGISKLERVARSNPKFIPPEF
ncbi:MAG: polysaccharide deacetylase family protein [Candidatus Zixiibacteriota bacterium]